MVSMSGDKCNLVQWEIDTFAISPHAYITYTYKYILNYTNMYT